jgi:putative membrane protein
VMDQTERRTTGPDASTKLAIERTYLAYSRTMLSWVRTATALITFGFSIQQFFRIAGQGVAESKRLIGPHEFGLTMVIIGLLALLLAALDHRWAIQALQAQYKTTEQYPRLPRSKARVLAALIGLLGVLALISMLLRE